MNKIKLLLSVVIISLLLGGSVLAASSVDPSRMIISARPLGMGRGFAGLANDVNALFINPAGLAQLKFPAFSGTSRKLFFDQTLYTQYLFAFPLEWGSFGLGYTDANTGGSYPTYVDPVTGRFMVNSSQEAYSYDNNLIVISYAKYFQYNLALGLNYKLFNQSLSNGGIGLAARGAGFDAGILYHPYRWLSIGGNYQNIGASIKWNNSGKTQETVGSQIKTGVAVNVVGSRDALYKYYNHKGVVTLDLDFPMQGILAQSNTLLYHLGAEWNPTKNLAIRIGYDQDYGAPGTSGTTGNICFGIGFFRAGFQFDYAYYPGSGVGGGERNPHYFSLSYTGWAEPPAAPPPPKPKEKTFDTKNVYLFDINIPKNRSLTPKAYTGIVGEEGKLFERYELSTTTETETIETASGEPEAEITPEEIEKILAPSPTLSPTRETETTGEALTLENKTTEEVVSAKEATKETISPTNPAPTAEVITRTVTREIRLLITREAGPVENAIVRIATHEVVPFTNGKFSLAAYPLETGLNIIKATLEKKYVTESWIPITPEAEAAITTPEIVAKTTPEAKTTAASTPEAILETIEVPTETSSVEPKTIAASPETVAPSLEIAAAPTMESITQITYEVVASSEVRLFRYKPFKDVYMEHWAVEPIAFISGFKIIKGYPDQTFKPKRGITRAELITLLMRSLPDINWDQVSVEASPFKDVIADHWALPYIAEAVKQGVITGYPDGTFKPKKMVTRAEGITIITRFAKIDLPSKEVETQPFDDVPPTHWVNPYLQQAKAAGLLIYIGLGNFEPKALFTRAEATEVLFRTPFIQEKVELFWKEGLEAATLYPKTLEEKPLNTEQHLGTQGKEEEEETQGQELEQFDHPVF